MVLTLEVGDQTPVSFGGMGFLSFCFAAKSTDGVCGLEGPGMDKFSRERSVTREVGARSRGRWIRALCTKILPGAANSQWLGVVVSMCCDKDASSIGGVEMVSRKEES